MNNVLAHTVYVCSFFQFLHVLKWIDQISKACQAAVIRNLWIKAAPILLSLLGLPPNRFGRADSRRCSCSGREWKWAHWSWAVWADFPVVFVLSLPSLLWGSEVPQHPVGPMGAEALDQPVERFLFFKSNPENWPNICTHHHHHIICMQEVVETNFITSVTSSTWRTPGLFPAGIELLSALCEKGVHLGTSDPAHMVMTPLFPVVWLESVCLLSKILTQHLFICLSAVVQVQLRLQVWSRHDLISYQHPPSLWN